MATRELIRNFVTNTFFVENLSDSDSFLRSGVIDSTGILELAEFVEQQFEIKIEDTELIPENVDSVDNLVRFIDGKRQRAAT